ncbi:pyridoxamine 5'-phosphate oxidase family protein [Metallumcola ferriviriculae]|uniref:Pyridoxamine 5'-phosphate oxidase family protein n=1 Tax=Metallumcola ferriviriculae TaxID=3039180 RepID=A0AAU0UP07_9FIRM|nr:pyridoxamine 5'-phosphate oxidase family protein [Desulfitibacteraceae bacterium MK1]
MVITNDVKAVIEQAPFVPITTVSADGQPHLIVVGKVKEVRDDDILVFGIYKMETTQQNITDNGLMQVGIAATDDGPKGFRLSGKACVEGKEVLFKTEKVESLL